MGYWRALPGARGLKHGLLACGAWREGSSVWNSGAYRLARGALGLPHGAVGTWRLARGRWGFTRRLLARDVWRLARGAWRAYVFGAWSLAPEV